MIANTIKPIVNSSKSEDSIEVFLF